MSDYGPIKKLQNTMQQPIQNGFGFFPFDTK